MTERQAASERGTKDRTWLTRTYAGHSTAEASNELYRRNRFQEIVRAYEESPAAGGRHKVS